MGCASGYSVQSATVSCRAALCEFGSGDSVSDREELLGTTSSNLACASAVRVRRPLADGATWSASSRKCYAEFGTAARRSTSAWSTCTFNDACSRVEGRSAVQGVWGSNASLSLHTTAAARALNGSYFRTSSALN